jgi:cytochrome c peroxidase
MKILFGFILVCLVGLANLNFKVPLPIDDRKSPQTTAELGEELFFDPILSSDYSISCASCHKPEFAFADNQPLSLGVNNAFTARNTPSVMYTNLSNVVFWDGRAKTLEHQAFFPITHPGEMNNPREEVVKRLKADKYYSAAFAKLYKEGLTIVTVARSLADFQRTLKFNNSPYDRWFWGDNDALTKQQRRGLRLFIGKGNCWRCHSTGFGTDVVSTVFNIGTYNGKEYNDPGRFGITKDSADLGKFKVPHMRNLKFTAPYMHDGSMKTLRDVLVYYNKPRDLIKGIINLDSINMKDSLGLTDAEMDDMEAFMLALTDDDAEVRLKEFQRKADVAMKRRRQALAKH